MTTILANFPAYTIISPEKNVLKHGESFMVPFPSIRNPNEMIWREFKIGSVVSCAIECNECPIEELKKAMAFGHELHYVFGCGATITSHNRPHETKKGFKFGDKVRFEGHTFELVPEANGNVGLKEVAE